MHRGLALLPGYEGLIEQLDGLAQTERNAPRGNSWLDKLLVKNQNPDPHSDQFLAFEELARRRLAVYTAYMTPGFRCGWVHYHLARRLEAFIEAIEQELAPRLMIFFPPRHGKTNEASICFPSFALGKHPEWDNITTSYSADLAFRNSAAVRNIIDTQAYQRLFPETRLSPRRTAVDDWSTTSGGQQRAAGVGGGILGMGAHIFVVDDPVRNADDADSETARETLWGFYGGVAQTRMAPGGGIVIIQQRWSPVDLCGRLLKGQEEQEIAHAETLRLAEALYRQTLERARDRGLDDDLIRASSAYRDAKENFDAIERWEVFSYPALAECDEYLDEHDRIVYENTTKAPPLPEQALPEVPPPGRVRRLRLPGEALHTERYSRGALLSKKNAPAMQPRFWSAMYQQNPVAAEGNFFREEDLVEREPLSEVALQDCRIILTGDLAISQKKRASQTALFALAVLPAEEYLVLDFERGRWGTYDIEEHLVTMARTWGPEKIGFEWEKIAQSLYPVFKKRFQQEGIDVSWDETLVPVSDKLSRAGMLQGLVQRHKFIIPVRPLRKNKELKQAFREFPDGSLVDVIDAGAWAARLAVKMAPRVRPKPRSSVKTVQEKLQEYLSSQYSTAGGMMGA